MKNTVLILVLGSMLVIAITIFNIWANRALHRQCLAQGGVYHQSAEASRSRCTFATQPKPVDKGGR
jgi:hypothetical protein